MKWLDRLIKTLSGEHRPSVEAARQQLQAELAVIDAILSAGGDEEAWQAYVSGAEKLDGTLRAMIGYELAKKQPTRCQSGFHTNAGSGVFPAPFLFYDWIYWKDPRYPGDMGGTSFRIERDCFADRSPVLWYTDEDGFPQDEKQLQLMEQLSDGLCGFEMAEQDGKRYVHFRLSDSAPEGYLLAVPRAGEFCCTMGEVANGAYIPLHEDNFCMK